ncbi:unnamed protein product [Lota lota]
MSGAISVEADKLSVTTLGPRVGPVPRQCQRLPVMTAAHGGAKWLRPCQDIITSRWACPALSFAWGRMGVKSETPQKKLDIYSIMATAPLIRSPGGWRLRVHRSSRYRAVGQSEMKRH